MSQQSRNVCNTCGGSGEIGYFQGESRFFVTREECPACCGFGYALDQENPAPGDGAEGAAAASDEQEEGDGDE